MKFIWPLIKSYQYITQSFGEIWPGNDAKNKLHTGIDIRVPVDSSVFACANGSVVKVGLSSGTIDWGRYIILEHEDKISHSVYHHISEKVKEGDTVIAGSLIATTAKIPAPHLHLGIWSGIFTPITIRGALPYGEFVGKAKPYPNDPAFPGNFLNPEDSSLFEYDFLEEPIILAENNQDIFYRNLKSGDTGNDVKMLQVILNTDLETSVAFVGQGSPGQETEVFGNLTEKAVQKFQIKYGIAMVGSPGFGMVGPKTREKLAELLLNTRSK